MILSDPNLLGKRRQKDRGGKSKFNYTSDEIRVLKGLEPVRVRPNMYIPDLGVRGLHHLVWELVSNSIDEFSAGFGDLIHVKLETKLNRLTVRDFGRGIPFDLDDSPDNPIRLVFTKLHSGGKFDSRVYKQSGGTFGVGLGVVNALSKFCLALSFRGGLGFAQLFSRGCFEDAGYFDHDFPDGTLVSFIPDPEFFGGLKFDSRELSLRLENLVFVNSGLSIIFEVDGNVMRFSSRPFSELPAARGLNEGDVFSLEGVHPEFAYEVAFSFGTFEGVRGLHFVNSIEVQNSFVSECFQKILIGLVKKSLGLSSLPLSQVFGLCVCTNLRADVGQILFKGQSKDSFSSKSDFLLKLENHLLDLVYNSLPNFKRPLLAWGQMIKEVIQARSRARSVRRQLKRVSSDFLLPGKLYDCTSKRVLERELYICEGESAGGSLKLARDRRFQAIMPVKGKTLNVLKGSYRKVLMNKELMDIFVALGGRIRGTKVVIPKFRYGKVVIATDPDTDGSHITVLLLSFFFVYLRPFVEAGGLFTVRCPLYVARRGSQKRFLYSESELEESGCGKWIVTRFKGLGEMSPQQIQIILKPELRRLKQITIEDEGRVEDLLRILLGSSVEKRLRFLKEQVEALGGGYV